MTRPLRRDQSAGSLIFPAVVVIAGATAYGLAKSDNGHAAGPWVFGFILSGWVISLCLHEFMHSVVALAGGDISVRARGYLTLNPLRYTSWVFSLLIPVILLIAGGVPLPGGAVLIENHRLRHRYWSSLISAAGPLTNLVLAVVLTQVAAHVADPGYLTAAISFLAVLQFLAFILNLLPVPGLDGFGILDPYLPARFHRFIAPVRPWIGLALFVVLYSSPRASSIVFTPAYWLFDQLGGNRGLAGAAAGLFQFWRN